MIWVRVKRSGLEGRIVGWCPDKRGRPQAMVQVRDKIIAFRLGQLRVTTAPKLRGVA